MRTFRQRALSASFSAVLTGSLLSFTGAVRAEDAEGEAPHASGNVETATPAPSEYAAAPSQTRASSTNEPTFETETQRMTWPNVPLLTTGATVFGLSYLPAVIGGAVSDAKGKDDLYIPVAGPWMMLTQGPDETGGQKALLAIDGVAQGLGALMLVSSFFIPQKTTSHWYLIGSNEVQLAPSRVGTGYGMGAAGHF